MSLVLIRVFLVTAILLLLAAGAATDMRLRIIPNRVVALVGLAGFTLNVMAKPGMAWASLLVALILLIALGALAHFNIIGGGDAKLLAAVTLMAPLDRIGTLLTEIALAGGLLSAAYFVAHCTFRNTPTAVPSVSGGGFLEHERARIATGKSVPYALAILAGVGFYVVSELYQCWSATSCSL